MARSWGPVLLGAAFVVWAALPFVPGRFDRPREALAGPSGPIEPTPPPDPSAVSAFVHQSAMVHVFDTDADAVTTRMSDGPHYVNDHSLIQGKDGAWHLFGIFHSEERTDDDAEKDFIHAVAKEPDPARWEDGAFEAALKPYTIALRADRNIGETHIWAPHVVAAEGRYWMIYQGGGPDWDHASIRLAESDDLYRWTRASQIPLFEDVCVARDPMLVRRDDLWALYYTRCESTTRRVSGVASRVSRDLAHWSEARMVLTLGDTPMMPNSGFSESPFVFERNGYQYLSITSYPLAWDATLVYRSPAPYAFPSVPFTRLRAHAAEWVASRDGRRMFMTHAGSGQRGVWLSSIDGI